MSRVSIKGIIGRECSNAAAYGWEWKTDDGGMFQLVGLRGVSGPMSVGFKAKGNDSWTTMRMADIWSVNGSREDFLRQVRAFVAQQDV